MKPIDTATRRSLSVSLLVALVAFGATLALSILVVSFVAMPTADGDSAPVIERAGSRLVANNANARASDNAMIVANRRDAPLTILAAGTGPIRAVDYGVVVVEAAPVPPPLEVALIWVRRGEAGKAYEQRLDVDANRIVLTTLDRNPDWRGDIEFVAIGIKGVTDQPWSIERFRLEPLRVGGVFADAVNGWAAFERWDGRSINVVFGGREDQRAWLPPLVFAAAIVAALVMAAAARRRRAALPPIGLALPFLLAWIVLDLRWQSNLVDQARFTRSEFGGRSWEARHLAMEDGELFRFTQAALARLPDDPVRLFANSDHEYFRRRAGYHLYPHNVLAYNWEEPNLLRPGDYVFFFQKAEVRYDTGARELIWKGGQRVKADALLAQRGAGLFLVRASEGNP